MAIKKETLEKIAAVLKVDPAKFVADVQAPEEKDFTVPELQTFTAEELTARDEAKITEGKTAGKKEGENAGKEIAIKDLKKTFGLEFEGKDMEKLKTEITNKYAKGDESLKEQVKLLQQQVQAKDTEITAEKKRTEETLFDFELISQLPANRDKKLNDREYLTVIKSNLQFEKTDTGMVVKKGNEIWRDPKTTNPLPPADAIKTFFEERKWIDAGSGGGPNGRGAGDGAAGKFTKLSEVIQSWEKEGKNTASAEFQAHVQGLLKENPDLDLKG